MAPFTLGVVTILQGLYSLIWILIAMDVGSIAFDLRDVNEASGLMIAVMVVGAMVVSPVIGMMMHTASRNLYRHLKDRWAFDVFTSAPVTKRLAEIQNASAADRSTVSNILKLNEEGIRKSSEILHSIHYKVLLRSPRFHALTQTYRTQYRLARGFVVPSAIIALLVPFWDVTSDLPDVERLGIFTLSGLQLSLLAGLFGVMSFVAFRERAYRYTSALMMAYITLETEKNTD